MNNQKFFGLDSRFWRMSGVCLMAASLLPACSAEVGEFEELEFVGETEQAVGPGGTNNLPPAAIDSDSLARGVTNSYGITSSSIADPIQLCANGTITANGCGLRSQWQAWMDANTADRVPLMKGIVKCALGSEFTITDSSGAFAFPGQWGLYSSWKNNRLTGQDKRERMSACILSLLNGNNQTLNLCIIGPGGSPFSDACSDPEITIREAGFFGDLFASTPRAYVAGPDTDEPALTGRACTSTQGIYCCAESDTSCAHRIVLAGAILGSPDQNYANKRCNAALVNSGGNEYCPSFFSTREPNYNYVHVFTSFVPPIP